MRSSVWRWNVAGGLFVLTLAVGLAWLFLWPASPNRYVIRNASGAEIREIRLTAGYRGRPETRFVRPALGSGESWTMQHSYLDSLVRLEFQLGSRAIAFDSGYIDLWRGEGWVLEIQPDGGVKQGYDYPGHKIR